MTEPAAAVAALPPVRRQVVVAASPERAFEAWTSELGDWWPFDSHSVCGDGATAAFVDGRLVETGPDGTSHVWGTVTEWEPGRRVTMTWHPGQDQTAATTVDVQFDQLAEAKTLVTLTHTGWERRADAVEARENYRTGWVVVVTQYVSTTEEAASAEPGPHDTDATWLVLQHSVWEPASGGVFSDPRFAGHIEFLRQCEARGWLVAAGNLPDSPGSGMTVLRVPDPETATAVAAAQDEDRSVTDGLFGVHVRPWNVSLTALD